MNRTRDAKCLFRSRDKLNELESVNYKITNYDLNFKFDGELLDSFAEHKEASGRMLRQRRKGNAFFIEIRLSDRRGDNGMASVLPKDIEASV